jgi:8-oxo-dGTP diphosphatase
METLISSDLSRPLTFVDVVIFAVRTARLEVLLVRRSTDKSEPFPGRWSLPGGCVDLLHDTDLLACAKRLLIQGAQKGTRDNPYLEQLGSWGSAVRDPRGWSTSHVYFALVPQSYQSARSAKTKLSRAAPLSPLAQLAQLPQLSEEDSQEAALGWFAINALPSSNELAFDHAQILRAAIQRLLNKVEYTSLPAFLLAEPFTLPQLQSTFEIVLGRLVDKSGFRTRMLAMNFLEEVGFQSDRARRQAMGYRLRDRSAPVIFPRTFSPRQAHLLVR